MGYKNLTSCIADLESTKQLIRVTAEIDADLEAACIQRRVYQAGGPALLFTNVKGCRFPMVGNLFGTLESVETRPAAEFRALAEAPAALLPILLV